METHAETLAGHRQGLERVPGRHSRFNAAGQPTQASFPCETNAYGANGRTESVTDGRGATTMAYEADCDRVASVTDPATGTISYKYRLSGERESVTLPGGGVWNYSYDLLQNRETLPKDDANSVSLRLTAITDDQGRRVDYGFDKAGVLCWARFNQTFDAGGEPLSYCRTDYLYDKIDGSPITPHYTHRWTTQVKNTWHYKDQQGAWQQSLLVQNDYIYSDTGNRLTRAISDGGGPIRTEAYGYDALSRLTDVDYDDGEVQSYAFDPMGNRTNKTVNQTSEGYTYNAANMLLTRGNGSYTNDANGNTLTGGGRTNTWDEQNRLTQCAFQGATSTFVYGSDGLRRQSTTGGVSTDYLLDGQSVVRSTDSNSNTLTYLTGPRGPEYERSGNNAPKWNLYDGLGSVVGTVDTNGNILSKRKFDVYGANRGLIGEAGTKHKFVGGLGHPSEDETGLVYMRARWMDPSDGRFVSEDPDQHSSNWYLYADCNPVNRIDKDGNRSEGLWELGDFFEKLGLATLGSTRNTLGQAAQQLMASLGSTAKAKGRAINGIRLGMQGVGGLRESLACLGFGRAAKIMSYLTDEDDPNLHDKLHKLHEQFFH